MLLQDLRCANQAVYYNSCRIVSSIPSKSGSIEVNTQCGAVFNLEFCVVLFSDVYEGYLSRFPNICSCIVPSNSGHYKIAIYSRTNKFKS